VREHREAPGDRLAGKAILVTGAGGGIGRGSVQPLVNEGASVIAADLNLPAAHGVAQEVGAAAEAVALDVTDGDAVAAAVADISARHGRIDGLLHCAADVRFINQEDRRLTELDDTVWKRMLELHLTGAFLACKHVGRQMLRQGSGSIVLCGSVDAHFGVAGLDSYTAAKGGVHALARSFAAGVAPDGVRVNVLAPSFVETEAQAEWLADPASRALIERLHMLPIPSPADIAAAAVYLLSDESRAVTGATIPVDGGYSAFKARDDVMAAMNPERASATRGKRDRTDG
jgi:NAD(P)-dependent dehydrogenase (short-subunit alcohol dehydrogenase family)